MADPSGIELLEGSFENILTALSSGIISLSNAALSAGAGAATKIPGEFFAGCEKLQNVYVPAGIKSIGYRANMEENVY